MIGEIICESRKAKGLTQEGLAEMSKVNLRTIQRIENKESDPRGKTLSLICEALELNIEEVLNSEKQHNKNRVKSDLVHGYKLAPKRIRLLANLTEFFIFFVIFIGPILLYKILTKDMDPNVGAFVKIEHLVFFSLLVGGVLYPVFSGNLGHKIFKLKVICAESGGDYKKASEGAIREFLKYASSFLIIPIIWLLWDKNNQNLYDKLTKTFVVERG
ncbi:helix-turn-helix domain-containing protein [Cyclobacterium qasimii]|uniref:helix-turn-helix domain-containing protein n=1 Tax=Cyclobacterium qasimii TaxID=1350429 RepID=UPI00190F5193|nr:helix-turn-helix domain-containing protein [Cyclobacterium qasimii]